MGYSIIIDFPEPRVLDDEFWRRLDKAMAMGGYRAYESSVTVDADPSMAFREIGKNCPSSRLEIGCRYMIHSASRDFEVYFDGLHETFGPASRFKLRMLSTPNTLLSSDAGAERLTDVMLRIDRIIRAIHNAFSPADVCFWDTKADIKVTLRADEVPREWCCWGELRYGFQSESWNLGDWADRDVRSDFPLVQEGTCVFLWTSGRKNIGKKLLLLQTLREGYWVRGCNRETDFHTPERHVRIALAERLWPCKTAADVFACIGRPSFRLGPYWHSDTEWEDDDLPPIVDQMVYLGMIPKAAAIVRVWADGMVTALYAGYPR